LAPAGREVTEGPPAEGPVPRRVRPGCYCVLRTIDLPKDEFSAAEQAQVLAGEAGALVNVILVQDSDSGQVTAHDLGC
jgi:hypothetical protein